MMASENGKLKKVITGKGTRWLYPRVWDPKAFSGAGVPKFSVCLLIPKEDETTVEKIRSAIRSAYEEGKEKLKGDAEVVPPLEDLKTPLRDGDAERPGNEIYEDCFFVNASSSRAPGIVDADGKRIEDHSEIHTGVCGRASISFYAYNHPGNRGIACLLNNLQKISDGEPLEERLNPADDFRTDDADKDDDDLLR